ncbi:MAG TPA: pyridoxamine 5'-phosphate oxidase [Bacteroidales bacterium]|nr:pyridoxamine 5'-phosphate oxidase [Bacteroidales bacterium]
MAGLHNEFTKRTLKVEDMNPDPRHQFSRWLDDYIQLNLNDGIAVSLSTIDREGFPSSRTVYMRDCDEKGFIFYTNYNSNKGEEIKANNKASLLFFWPELERQVRVWGFVEKVEKEISDAYFQERSKGSQAGAWISNQSAEIATRETLENMHRAFLRNVGDKLIPRPDFWGGYRLVPIRFEFWQGRPSRLHDRFLYSSRGESWQIARLAP